MSQILFIDFWNCSPHIETSLELAKNEADAGNLVTFLFLGHATRYKEGITLSKRSAGFLTPLPEEKGIALINSKNIKFLSLNHIPKYQGVVNTKFLNIEQLTAFNYKGADLGVGVASSLISNLKNSNPLVEKYEEIIHEMILSAIEVYEFLIDFINKLNPDLVYIFNGRFCNQRAAMCSVLKLNKKILFHERGCSQDHYDLIPYMFHDQIKVKDRIIDLWRNDKSNAAFEIGSQYFIDKRSGFIKQGKSFTSSHLKNYLPKLNKNKKIVTFFSSSDYEFAAVGDMFKWQGWSNQMEAVLSLIKICSDIPEIQLVIRLHPNLKDVSEADQNLWKALELNNHITFISYDVPVDSYALVESSDLIINAGSTIGIEAVFWGKPSVTLGPAFYPLMNATYGATNEDELKSLLLRIESLTVNKEAAIALGYFINTFGVKFKFYKAITFTSGEFLGHNLQNKSKYWNNFQIIKGIYKRRIQKIKNLFYF